MKHGFTASLCLLAAVALVGRLPGLDQRPLHTDESVHTLKFQSLWDEGRYRYDPREFHGPTLYYATYVVAWLRGAPDFIHTTEVTYRLVPVLAGVGLILLLFLARSALGTAATLWAAAFTAFSPAMVFYSRYYIHELLLVFLSFLWLLALRHYLGAPHLAWALLAGAALGLMQATKETFVFVLLATGVGVGLTLTWARRAGPETAARLGTMRPAHWVAGLAVAVTISVVLFTSFFTQWSGPWDSVRTYIPWFRRAEGGSPHVHPAYYYLSLLTWVHRGRGPFWTEGLILALAAVGLVAALRRRGLAVGETRSVRFLGFYTLTLMLVYSLIPYKTPWCLLGFLHGLILLAGVGAAELFRLARRPAVRLGLSLGLLAGLGHLGWQAFQASYRYADDQRNPYVYAHTLSDIFNLVDQVEAIARSQPAGYRLKVKVIAEGADYWPLPWYLRRFGTQAEWWSELHPDARAPVVIISARLAPALESRLGPAYQAAGFFGLRPSVFLRLYVESDVWQTYLQSLRQP